VLTKKLRKTILKAASAPAPALNEDISEAIDSYKNDPPELTDFLESLQETSAQRAGLYLRTIKAHYKPLWKKLLKQAQEEDVLPLEEEEEALPPDEPFPEGQDGEDEVLEDEPEEGNRRGQDEEPPADEEEEDFLEEGQDDEEAVEPVVEPEEVEEAEADPAIDMMLFGEESENPHWSVFADGKPLAEIQLADQSNAEEIKDLFVTEDYANHVVDACKGPMGIKNTLKSIRARFYVAAVNKGRLAQRAERKAAAQQEGELAERLANLKEDFLNHLNLAVAASMKGMFLKNKLRENLIKKARAAGLISANHIVDEAFQESGQEFLTDLITQANKWMGYSPEAMGEITAEIMQAQNAVQDGDGSLASDPPEPALGADDTEGLQELQEKQARFAANGMVNVPLHTRRASGTSYRKDTQFNFTSALSRRKASKALGL
jgi:hypothetical protein